MPADAAQIVVVRAPADDLVCRCYVPELTVEQVCRLSRTASELVRTVALLDRTLTRRQKQPAPFFATVEAEGVDIAALDAVRCNNPEQRENPGLRRGRLPCGLAHAARTGLAEDLLTMDRSRRAARICPPCAG